MTSGRRFRFVPPVLALVVTVLVGCSTIGTGTGSGFETSVGRKFAALRDKPPVLREFLQAMPKGADLHNHLNGAVYAESFIEWAAADGKCISTTSLAATTPPCFGDSVPAANALTDATLRNRVIDAWSMRDFVASSGSSGHDQFFATFGRFSAAASGRTGDALAEVARRSNAQGLQYLELMLTPAGQGSAALAAAVPWRDDLTANAVASLLAPELTAATAAASTQLDAAEARMRAVLRCDGSGSDPACSVTVRYISQVYRATGPAAVFSQMVTAFQMASVDRRFVGLNLVGPEDDRVSMADYGLHMQMLEVLHSFFPNVKIALHAGELTLGLVPPEGLESHVRQAVTTGHASRIGHGVDISYEKDAGATMDEMAARGIPVEILLSSNAQILGVEGQRHPFPTYRAEGVVTILATDDQGVSRSDITNEYQRAVESYGLSYKDLKTMARNSVEMSFLEGGSLWRNPRLSDRAAECESDDVGQAPSRGCQAYLDANPRALVEWRLEAAFAQFERWSVQRFTTAVTGPIS